MMKVKEHSDLLSAQYPVKCLNPDHVCYNITTMAPPPKLMSLHTRHHSTVLPLLAGTKKETLKAVHTAAVNNAVTSQENNRVLRDRPPDISKEETTLKRKQLRSGHCRLLNSYRNRLEPT